MTRKSHHSMPRTGTFWNKKDEDLCTEIVRVSGWIRVVAGVTTIVYDPSWVVWGTVIVPRKNPLLSDIVEFVARTVAPLRSSMFKTTPPMPLEPESRTYPVTPSELPETTDWPLEGVRIAVNPAGGGWTVKVMLAELLPAVIAGYGSKSPPPGPVVAPKATVSW